MILKAAASDLAFKRGRFSWLYDLIPRILGIMGGLILWELLGKAQISVIIPSATETVLTVFGMFLESEFQKSLIVSISNFLAGFGLAGVIGILVGVLMAHFRSVEHFLNPYLSIGLSAPMIAFIPILILLFGTGGNVRTAVAFVFAAPIITINTFTGVRNVKSSLLEMAYSFGATPAKTFWYIRIPAALPLIFAALRTGSRCAVNGVVVGEMLIAIVGLGAIILTAANTFNGARLFSVLIAICILAVAADCLLRWTQKRLVPWSEKIHKGV